MAAVLALPLQLHLYILKKCENNIKAKVPDQNSSFYKCRYVKITCALEDNWCTEKNQSVGLRQFIHGLVGTSQCLLSKVYTRVILFNENSFKLSVCGQSYPQIPKYHCVIVIPQSRLSGQQVGFLPMSGRCPKAQGCFNFSFCLITTDPRNTFHMDFSSPK